SGKQHPRRGTVGRALHPAEGHLHIVHYDRSHWTKAVDSRLGEGNFPYKLEIAYDDQGLACRVPDYFASRVSCQEEVIGLQKRSIIAGISQILFYFVCQRPA